MVSSERYRAERKREAKLRYKYYHYCGECGEYSRNKLKYAHPKKDRMICGKCRRRLW